MFLDTKFQISFRVVRDTLWRQEDTLVEFRFNPLIPVTEIPFLAL